VVVGGAVGLGAAVLATAFVVAGRAAAVEGVAFATFAAVVAAAFDTADVVFTELVTALAVVADDDAAPLLLARVVPDVAAADPDPEPDPERDPDPDPDDEELTDAAASSPPESDDEPPVDDEADGEESDAALSDTAVDPSVDDEADDEESAGTDAAVELADTSGSAASVAPGSPSVRTMYVCPARTARPIGTRIANAPTMMSRRVARG
jgi:hypothetical protein